jgi:hypothetical protein
MQIGGEDMVSSSQVRFFRSNPSLSTGPKGLISFHILGRRIIVVNSKKVTDDLFSKRSSNYNDRPFPPMSGVLMRREKSPFYMYVKYAFSFYQGYSIASSSYNERFRKYRRLMQRAMNSSASRAYWGMEEDAAKHTVGQIIESPEKLFQHIRSNSAFIIMKLTYGYTISDHNDHFVENAEKAIKIGSLAAAPGKWLVDSIPIRE